MNTDASRFRRCLAAVLMSAAGISSVQSATVTAQWTFDDSGNASGSIANVGGFAGTFVGSAGRSASGDGVSGFPGDYSFDPRALANVGDGAMTSNTAEFLSALNTATGSQAMSISYWQFVESTPNSTAFWGNSPTAVGTGGTRGLNAHSPWSNGNLYFDTAGCCDPPNRIFGPLGAVIGEWQHITLVYNNGTRDAYRDTTLVATGSGGLSLASDFDAFIVGNDNLMATLGMDARLDNFTIWTGALTPAEIAVLSVRPVPEPSAGVFAVLGAVAASLCRRRSASPR